MNTTKIYLSYLSREEKPKMTGLMPFLYLGGNEGKQELIDVAGDIYGGDTKIEPQWDNGRYPHEWSAHTYDKTLHYYTLLQFETKDMTEEALNLLGRTDSRDFPYYYAIMLCKEDRKLYVVSFKDDGVPNWNYTYHTDRVKPFEDVTIPLIVPGSTIYRMEDALHAEINRRLANNRPLFKECEAYVQMTVNDQHGNYTDIVGRTVEDVFRDYADNYTGYRNYRRQMASEWEISDHDVRKRYENWKQTAKGLKSDFDKFYGGGIVD